MFKKIISNFLSALKGVSQDYTKISIDRAIFYLAVPMIAEMVMESIFSVVDIYFVGQISNEAVSVVGLTESVLFIIFSIAMGIGMAATATVSRFTGEKNPEKANKSTISSIYLAVLASIVISIIGWNYSEEILQLMGANSKVISEGAGFTKIMLVSNLTIVLLFVINGAFRGAGNAAIAFWSLAIGNGINMLLDPLLIFGMFGFPKLGVEGAAWASAIGRGLGVCFQIYMLMSKSGVIRIRFSDFTPDFDSIKSLAKISLGGTGQMLVSSASWIFIYMIIADFGTVNIASWTITLRIMMFAILPAWGLASAAATLVGQNLGAGFPDRAENAVLRSATFTTIFMLCLSVICIFSADYSLSFFTNDPDVIRIGSEAMIWVSSAYVFFGFGMVATQCFNGAGDTRTPTVLNAITYWLIQVPFAYMLAIYFEFDMIGVYLAIILSSASLAVLSAWVFRKGRWKDHVVSA
jgi:MATE family, multidrug efflux pump